jgi:hypothetical protein
VPFIDGRTLATPSLHFNAAVRQRIGKRAHGREARGGPAVHRWCGREARAGATCGGGTDFKGIGKARGEARKARQARRGRGVLPGELSQLALFQCEFLQKLNISVQSGEYES